MRLSVCNLLFAAAVTHALQLSDGQQRPLLNDGGLAQPAKRVAVIGAPSLLSVCCKSASLKIPCVGAGSAGSSAAYYLRNFATTANISVNVTVFERNEYIGGRSTTVNAFDDPSQPVELGASIFVSVNRNLVSACKAFNLSVSTSKTRSGSGDEEAVLGVWDGKQFVFRQPLDAGRWEGWLSTARMLWRYGLAPIRTMRLMKSVVGRFLQLYEEPHFPFHSLSQAANDVGLSAVTAATGEEYLGQNGIGDLFARDVIQASTRVNYAQNLASIHGLEAMVCMATDGAMAVEGGNWQIFRAMLEAANTNVELECEVTSIERKTGGVYDVHFKSLENVSDLFHKSYDEVILAAPYQYANIDIQPPPKSIPEAINYVRLHVLLFTSPYALAPAFFGLGTDEAVPSIILTTLQPHERPIGNPQQGSTGFYSISTLGRVSNPSRLGKSDEYLYKIFSAQEIDTGFLSRILNVPQSVKSSRKFPITTWEHRKIWESYPYLPPRTTYDELRLDDEVANKDGGLWYSGGMESFISTMETSSLSGMNIARIIVDKWIDGGEDDWVEVVVPHAT